MRKKICKIKVKANLVEVEIILGSELQKYLIRHYCFL